MRARAATMANYTSAVRFESKSLVCSCRIFIPLYVYESKYFNFTCFMKIIPFFPDDPADTGIFCKCVRYLVAAYFRRIPAFEIVFIILSVSTTLPTSI